MADVIDVILADHARIRRLAEALDRCAASQSGGMAAGAVWTRLAEVLEAHMAAEEEIAYLALFRHGDGGGMMMRGAAADHADVREAVREAALDQAGGRAWWRAVNAAVRIIDDHMACEERAVLPALGRRAGPAERSVLARRWAAFTAARARDAAGAPARLRVGMSTGECAGQVVVALRGDLDATSAEGVGALVTTVAVRVPWLIVDLGELEFIDCAGLRALAGVQRRALRAGGSLVLAAPSRLVRRVLDLTGLMTGVPVCATVEEAAGLVSGQSVARKLPGPDMQDPIAGPSAAGLQRQQEEGQCDRHWQPGTADTQAPGR